MSRTVTSTFTWKERRYVLELTRYEIFMKASVVHRQTPSTGGRTVAIVTADLLSRPCSDFHYHADEHSEALEEMAAIFCEANGVASRVQHPQLQQTAVWGGGFLHIETIEVHPEYHGIDLSLRTLHELFLLLKNHWTLAVLEPTGLVQEDCEWKSHSFFRGTASASSSSSGCRPRDKLMRHFARMKFVQVTTTKPAENKAWFLTAETYFGNSHDHSAIPSPSSLWLGKAETARLEIFETPPAKRGGLNPTDHLFDSPTDRSTVSSLAAPRDVSSSSSLEEDEVLAAPLGIQMDASAFLPPQQPPSFAQYLMLFSPGDCDYSEDLEAVYRAMLMQGGGGGRTMQEINQRARELAEMDAAMNHAGDY